MLSKGESKWWLISTVFPSSCFNNLVGRVIYKLLNHVKEIVQEQVPPAYVLKQAGKAKVLKVC